MTKQKKKDKKKGNAANFITRNQALKKLQLQLSQFRKLCILKGIFPRDPKKKVKGKDKTYFLSKDITYLSHDPLVKKFREYQTWKKKIARARGRKDDDVLHRLRMAKPTYRLDNVIKERYPTFIDALRDLDDALCMIHLFSHLPSTGKIKPARVENCVRLAAEFQNYVIRARALRKVFVSIKGFYYQAEIEGQTITWLVPFSYTQTLPQQVDYRVMLSFLEFYETLLGFVNFKLYHALGLHYPPTLDQIKESRGEFLSSLILQTQNVSPPLKDVEGSKETTTVDESQRKKTQARVLSLKDKLIEFEKNLEESEETLTNIPTQEGEEGEDPEHDEAMRQIFVGDTEDHKEEEELQKFKNLFSGLKFFLSREVPKPSLEFVIKSFGGEVLWDDTCNPLIEADETITHQIVDRDTQIHRYLSREYIQPQWVYDCVNARILLPTDDYGTNSKLPPHLSPFVDDEAEGYVPEQRERLNRLIEAAKGLSSTKKQSKEDQEEEDQEEPQEGEEVEQLALLEAQYQKEVEGEEAGVSVEDIEKQKKDLETPFIESQQQKKKEKKEQETRFGEMMIPSRRKRRLYQRMEYTQKKKEEQIQNLMAKRKRSEQEENNEGLSKTEQVQKNQKTETKKDNTNQNDTKINKTNNNNNNNNKSNNNNKKKNDNQNNQNNQNNQKNKNKNKNKKQGQGANKKIKTQ